MMKYSETHEWIVVDEEGIGTVGVSRHAMRELGEVVYVQLPEVGQKMDQYEEACVLESTKAAADIYAPVSGEVVAVNHLVEKNLDILNQAPEGDGWLYKVKLTDLDEFEDLLPKEGYLSEVGPE